MKTKKKSVLFSKIFLTVVIVLFYSCARLDPVEDCMKGTLKLNIVLPTDVKSGNYVKAFSEESITISIYKNENKDFLLSYNGISNVPETIDLSEGSYQVKVSSTDYPEAAFEIPCYYGESDIFSIASQQTVPVTVSCFICNIPIKITYSEGTTVSFSSATTSVFNGKDSLIYNQGEERFGYFKPNSLIIKSYLTYGSKTKIITKEIENPKPGTNYTININTKLPGDISVTISFSDNTENLTFDLTDNGFVEKSDKYSLGDLLITEFMAEPDKEEEGEWIEIYNNTEIKQNLNGLVLRRMGVSSALTKITSDVIINSKGYVVLAGSSDATTNVDYVYDSDFSLNNDNTYKLSLATFGMDGETGFPIFLVNLKNEKFPVISEGKSIHLKSSVTDPYEAQKAENWKKTETKTPGEANTEEE